MPYELTSKEIVQAEYPDAIVVNFGEKRRFSIYIVDVNGIYRQEIGSGTTEVDAWDEAARRIKVRASSLRLPSLSEG